ncbi:MAG TPA: XdhC family protein [Saprospiraceae bacterium]|nr:XdhC family protein [Saprospiraceae bacterium]HMQ83579.1 XdhC family protein [Saprospiraceae bacterium]
MKDLLPQISQWLQEEKAMAMAFVLNTWGSAPRPLGSFLLMTSDMEMAGSVSGGCIEGQVLKAAQDSLETELSQRLQFGVSNEEAWASGLSCGGEVSVFVSPFFAQSADGKQVWEALNSALTENKPAILLTSLSEKAAHTLVFPDGKWVGHEPNEALLQQALTAFAHRYHQLISEGEEEYFVHVFPQKPQLIIIGAAHLAADLVQLAASFQFETIVIDPRGIFLHKTTFAQPPDQLHNQYPSEILSNMELNADVFAVVLSHDPKIDDNALQVLLRSEVAYIGALGSRKTHAKRQARLLEAGFTEVEIARIHGPVGIAINAVTAREIALSIMAEIIQVRNRSVA